MRLQFISVPVLFSARLSFGLQVTMPASNMVPKEMDERFMMPLQASKEDESPTTKSHEFIDSPSNGSLSKDDSTEDLDKFLDINGEEGHDFKQRQSDSSEKDVNLQVKECMDICVSGSKANGETEIPYIPDFLLDPVLSTTEQFVNELECYTLNHLAIHHHFLQKVSSAAMGKENTAKLLFQFFKAYSRFNKEFAGNVARLRDILSNAKHKEILDANLAEENGIYGEDTLQELQKLGIERNSVQDIPHPELYKDFVATFGKLLQRSYNYDPSDIVPENMVGIKKEAIAELTADGKLGLLAAIYFGSELIVPQLYSKLLQGLRLSCDMSNSDARFLILHIDVDKTHAENLRKIVIDNCVTKNDRIRLARNTEKILKARVDFYDTLIPSDLDRQN